ncbi:MAG: hypothetical protein ABR507_05145 [Actinomycetota bacterium]|nr:hypothetical protein [Actinomycetota bacterium]
MRQLHIREPWADLQFGSDKDKLNDLVLRIEILEARLRDLEMRVSDEAVSEREAISVGV